MNRSDALLALFGHEIEFHRLARASGLGVQDRERQHGVYALRRGYEPLLAAAEGVTAAAVRRFGEQLLSSGDPRDILAARDSVLRLLGHSPLGG
jgi:hypothetical protein